MASKLIVLLCCFMATVLAVEKYSDEFDNVDIQEILNNKKLLRSYANCILDKGRCTPDGKELKEHLQDALETGCEKCTDFQDKESKRVIKHLIKQELEIWKELTDRFDPKGIWRKKYEEQARAEGIIIPQD
uniref:Chemosensory protein 24/26b n=1 Tax=Heliconius charithonia TaxID=33434 RepID=A0AA49FQI1_HELCH|nr:chemosensory protein 24/26b [Heliconius charithonia]